uniref:Putative structural protein n=1 Tax=viral metagenome TaxID=1070528 RepID=A0A6H1ZLN7_9ZZZZ
MGIDLASTDAPFGFIPYGNVLSANIYAIVTAYGTAVYTGDAAEIGGTAITTKLYGTIQNMQVEETGAAGSMLGAVLALFDSTGMPASYIASSTTGDSTVAGYALVADHPLQKYLVAENGVTSSIVVANIGLNVDGVSTHAGDTNTGRSKMEIDSNTVADTATLAWKLLGVHPDDTISAAGTAGNHCRFIVMPNSAHIAPNVVGA